MRQATTPQFTDSPPAVTRLWTKVPGSVLRGLAREDMLRCILSPFLLSLWGRGDGTIRPARNIARRLRRIRGVRPFTLFPRVDGFIVRFRRSDQETTEKAPVAPRFRARLLSTWRSNEALPGACPQTTGCTATTSRMLAILFQASQSPRLSIPAPKMARKRKRYTMIDKSWHIDSSDYSVRYMVE